MLSYVQRDHIIRRLKIVHVVIIFASICFFTLLFFFSRNFDVNTLPAQIMLLLMGALAALSYISLLAIKTKKIPVTPMAVFFILNILTGVLVWLTGSLESPFIALYLILIVTTAQLYSYRAALVQALLAFGGVVFVFTAVSQGILPFYSLIPEHLAVVRYYPASLTLIFGTLYALLFLFTALATSSARILLYRPQKNASLDTTYQEKIIETMPTPVLVVDSDLIVLGGNAAAKKTFSFSSGESLSQRFSCGEDLAAALEEKRSVSGVWSGKEKQHTVSFRVVKEEAAKKEYRTYILFAALQ